MDTMKESQNRLSLEEKFNKSFLSRRVKEQIETDDPNQERIVIRNLFEPIMARLWEIAFPYMKDYQSDLMHDALILGNANVGDKFIWSFRETGTNIIPLRTKQSTFNILSLCHAISNPLDTYYMLTVVRIRHEMYADGFVTWMNLSSYEKLNKIVRENLVPINHIPKPIVIV